MNEGKTSTEIVLYSEVVLFQIEHYFESSKRFIDTKPFCRANPSDWFTNDGCQSAVTNSKRSIESCVHSSRTFIVL